MSDTINPSGVPQTPSDAPVNTQPFATGQGDQVPPVAPGAPAMPSSGAAGSVPPAGACGAAPAGPEGFAPVPPAGQVPPYSAQAQQPPQNIPGMPLFCLTGGMKFGWAAAGFLMGPVAILLAWLTNAHNFPEAKNAAVKFSLFGFLAQILLWVLVAGLFGCATCAAIGSLGPGYCYY